MFIKGNKKVAPMIIIRIYWPIEHDHAVPVVQDGKLVFAAEEERFTRHKHSSESRLLEL